MVSRRRVQVGLSLPGHFLCFIRAIVAGAPLLLLSSFVLAADNPQSGAPSGVKELEPGSLAGQLVQADGKPVADAQVLLRGKRRRDAKSDKDGRFRFDGLPPGPFRILAIKEKLVSPSQEVEGRKINGSPWGRFEPLRIEMSPGKELNLVVTSATTGKPLEGARIRLFANRWRDAQTAKDGTVVIDGLLPNHFRVTIEAAGHAAIERQIDLSAADARLNFPIAMAPGGVVQGVVTDEKGQPLSGVRIGYREEGSPYPTPGRRPETDAQGHFRHDGIPLNAAIQVEVRQQGYRPHEQTVTLSPEHGEAKLNIKLLPKPRGGSIAGVVRDEKGKPIARASVVNHGNSSNEERNTTTDDQGRYVLDNLYESWQGFEIIVSAAGRSPTRQSVKPGPDGKPAHFDWTLEPGHFLHGRVVAEDGKPIAGAHVNLRGDPWSMPEPKQTDEQGRFEMDSLPAHPQFRISKPGFTELMDVSLRLDSPGPLTIVLQPMGILRGRVVDAVSGKPLPHFNVWLNFGTGRRRSDVQWSMSGDLVYPGRQFQSKDGTFTLKDLMNKMPVDLNVAAEGYFKTVLPLEVATTDEAKTAQVAMKRLDPTKLATFSGRILDHAGHPVGGVSVLLVISTTDPTGPENRRFLWMITKSGNLRNRGHFDQVLQTVSDSQGHFEFKNVLPEKYWQLAYWGEHVAQGRLMGDQTTRPGRLEKITIALLEPARIEGTIDRGKYPDASRVAAQLVGENWSEVETQLAEDQTKFEFRDLPPGEYRVSIQSKPVPSKQREGMFESRNLVNQRVRLKEGETKPVKF
jgi:hypothetical protein